MQSAPGPEVEILAQHIIGAAIEVHRVLGPGLDAVVYCEALTIESHRHGLELVRNKLVPVHYRDHVVGEDRVDFFFPGGVALNVVAAAEISLVVTEVLGHTLKRLRAPLGLAVNFWAPVLKNGIRRVSPVR